MLLWQESHYLETGSWQRVDAGTGKLADPPFFRIESIVQNQVLMHQAGCALWLGFHHSSCKFLGFHCPPCKFFCQFGFRFSSIWHWEVHQFIVFVICLYMMNTGFPGAWLFCEQHMLGSTWVWVVPGMWIIRWYHFCFDTKGRWSMGEGKDRSSPSSGSYICHLGTFSCPRFFSWGECNACAEASLWRMW